jgi:NAD(P) transhydrogenase subunit beta
MGYVELVYIVCAFLFIYGLKLLQRPDTARRGNLLSSLGMLVAVIVTLVANQVVDFR